MLSKQFPQDDNKQKPKKKERERKRQKTKDTIADLSPDISIITLNEKGLKIQIKRWLAEEILKHD